MSQPGKSNVLRSILAGAAGAMVFAVGFTPAHAATVLNRYERTCNQFGANCSSWVQVNPPYSSQVGNTCIQTNRQWGWAWVTATYTRTTPKGVSCKW